MLSAKQSVDWELARETEVLRKCCPSATLSTTNRPWPYSGSNPDRRGGKPTTNSLSYGAALWKVTILSKYVYTVVLEFSWRDYGI
jgi:hypothetical protein